MGFSNGVAYTSDSRDLISGRYRVIECLKAGQLAVVYRCEDLQIPGQEIVLKVLRERGKRMKSTIARFREGVIASYRVNHPNVVKTFSYICEEGLIAQTMEYVCGESLEARMARVEFLEIIEIVNILGQVCLGLNAIHEAGILHGNLNPGNILLEDSGKIKISDFGLSGLQPDVGLRTEVTLVGSIPYVSPEYLDTAKPDERSDIYSLGVIAYQMITGMKPVFGRSFYQNIANRLNSEPLRPSRIRDDCPEALSEIVSTCMHHEPKMRYQNVEELFIELRKHFPRLVPDDLVLDSGVIKLPECSISPEASGVAMLADSIEITNSIECSEEPEELDEEAGVAESSSGSRHYTLERRYNSLFTDTGFLELPLEWDVCVESSEITGPARGVSAEGDSEDSTEREYTSVFFERLWHGATNSGGGAGAEKRYADHGTSLRFKFIRGSVLLGVAILLLVVLMGGGDHSLLSGIWQFLSSSVTQNAFALSVVG